MNFIQSKLAGKVGQQAAAVLLSSLESYGYDIQDVSEQPQYWCRDTDFLIKKQNEKQIGVQVKWDYRINKTGNIFAETSNNLEKAQPGWLYYTKADTLFYGDSNQNKFYVFTVEDLKRFIASHDLQSRCCNDGFKHTSGLLVPVQLFKRESAHKVLELDINNVPTWDIIEATKQRNNSAYYAA